jgi:hypothetical protein
VIQPTHSLKQPRRFPIADDGPNPEANITNAIDWERSEISLDSRTFPSGTSSAFIKDKMGFDCGSTILVQPSKHPSALVPQSAENPNDDFLFEYDDDFESWEGHPHSGQYDGLDGMGDSGIGDYDAIVFSMGPTNSSRWNKFS